jgi:maltose alpha-D-glucosyltransferase/alpha-amylase
MAQNSSPREDLALVLLSNGWSGFLAGSGLVQLENSIAAWIPRQRWFGAKTRKVIAVRVLQWVALPAAAISLTAEPLAGSSLPAALFFVEIAYSDGPPDMYQLPVALTTGADAEKLTASHPQSILATLPTSMGPAVLHDATFADDFRKGLLSLMERNTTLTLSTPNAKSGTTEPTDDPTPYASHQDHLDAHAEPAFELVHLSEDLSSRVGSAEQSNTSILYGHQLILKLFRRLQPGENPDVEIGRFLTNVSHFPRIAPFLGEITIHPASGRKTTVAMLQELVANQSDGWQWFLDRLAEFFSSIAKLPAPPDAPAPSFLNQRAPLPEALEHARISLEAAALLGRRTAELHLALAIPTPDPAFAAEPFTSRDLSSDARRIDAQIGSTLKALKAKLASLTGPTADAAALLLSRRIDLFARANAITALTAAGQRIRIHGDYHLGQVLVTGVPETESTTEVGDFVLLDFEGEPARPLAERRQKQSPLKDVAGMMRSLSYAAYSGLDRYRTGNPPAAHHPDDDHLLAWARFWQNSASSEFLRAYRETVAANPALLPSPPGSQALLAAYLLEKALYELLYELNNRPGWLRIPLGGILDS